MSSSDTDNEQFKPMNLTSLEAFDEESETNTEDIDPDFDRFKALLEKNTFDEEPVEFKQLYDVKEDLEEIFFKPLVERKEKPPLKPEPEEPEDEVDGSLESEQDEEPEETPEEKGYREGLERGMAQGLDEGQKKGFEDGHKKGETEGFEKGEKQGFEEGHEKGLAQGLKEGFEDGEQKATEQTQKKAVEILGSLEETLKAADQTLYLLVDKYEVRIISLIEQIVEKAVMAQLEIDDEIVKHMIMDALKKLVHPEEVVLNVSHEDYEYIEMVKDEFFDEIRSLSSIAIQPDSSVKRGGCKVNTNTAAIAADPEIRLEAIFDAIRNAGIK